MARVRFYGKPGCHLCDDARAVVARAAARRAIAVDEIDVSVDPALNARYGQRIPVLEVDGETVFELFVDVGVLEQWLDRVSS